MNKIYSFFIIVCCVVNLVACAHKNCYHKKPHFFYIQHTEVDKFDYTFPCNPELVRFVNLTWLRHGKYDCYRYNSFVQDFPKKYGECVKGRTKNDIIRLLGKPTKDEKNTLKYFVSFDCQKYKLDYSKLRFYYDDNNIIIKVTFG